MGDIGANPELYHTRGKEYNFILVKLLIVVFRRVFGETYFLGENVKPTCNLNQIINGLYKSKQRFKHNFSPQIKLLGC